MSETTEILIRKVLDSCPDGSGTERWERLTVTINWNGEKPPNLKSYTSTGCWIITEEANHG